MVAFTFLLSVDAENIMDEITVLVAEDDEDDRLLMLEALSPLSNLLLHFVGNGRELLDYLREARRRPNLILIDMHMPLMDGREVLKEINSNGYRTIPIVCLTGLGNEWDRKSCLEHGAKDYLNKPSTFVEFSETLKSIVEKWAA